MFSFIWQLLVEGVAINGWSLLGAMIVTGSVVGLGVRKFLRERQPPVRPTAPVANVKGIDLEADGDGGFHDFLADDALKAAIAPHEKDDSTSPRLR